VCVFASELLLYRSTDGLGETSQRQGNDHNRSLRRQVTPVGQSEASKNREPLYHWLGWEGGGGGGGGGRREGGGLTMLALLHLGWMNETWGRERLAAALTNYLH